MSDQAKIKFDDYSWALNTLISHIYSCFQIKKKYAYPSAAVEEKSFPEELMKLIAHGGYFKRRAKKDPQLDSDTIHTIGNASVVLISD